GGMIKRRNFAHPGFVRDPIRAQDKLSRAHFEPQPVEQRAQQGVPREFGKVFENGSWPTLNARESAALSLPLATASPSSASSTPIQAPRPGALASASGSTTPSRDSARRTNSSRPPMRPLSTQRRSGPSPALRVPSMS